MFDIFEAHHRSAIGKLIHDTGVKRHPSIAIGESADEIASAFDGLIPVRLVGSIEAATAEAFALAPRPGTVLLAPACASWDMFRDYAERGDRFAAAARALMDTEVARG
jgi:UDP-N-acetylmuramoylalanine--D-glutamate ligase